MGGEKYERGRIPSHRARPRLGRVVTGLSLRLRLSRTQHPSGTLAAHPRTHPRPTAPTRDTRSSTASLRAPGRSLARPPARPHVGPASSQRSRTTAHHASPHSRYPLSPKPASRPSVLGTPFRIPAFALTLSLQRSSQAGFWSDVHSLPSLISHPHRASAKHPSLPARINLSCLRDRTYE